LCLLAKNRELQRFVAVKLKEDWAPQQIAGWLKDEYPENPGLWVSHETIYRSLFVQARGALKKELMGHLRSKRRIRREPAARAFAGSVYRDHGSPRCSQPTARCVLKSARSKGAIGYSCGWS
jgi:IS30 family transposase